MRIITTLAFVAALAATLAAVVPQQQAFPNTRKYGRATVEYKHSGFHVVANYDYSQRNHQTPWLLIDLAMVSARRFAVSRDNIRLTTPDERALPVAPQEELNADAAGIRLVLQNATIFRRELSGYFSQRASGLSDQLKFQVSPPGTTIVSSESIVDNDRVTHGAIFFRHLGGSWPVGTYRLVIDHADAKAVLPVTLE